MALNKAQAEARKESDEGLCRQCDAVPRLVHKILNVRTGGSLRMYKCECGQQTWIDQPE